MTTTELTYRDRAILRAVAAGRCEIAGGAWVALTVDGLSCCDQFAGQRLARAGLIVAGSGQARLTASGHALLAAA